MYGELRTLSGSGSDENKIGYSGGFVRGFCVRNSKWYAYIII